MRSLDDYISLIPPLNAGALNYKATISATVAPFADIQTFMSGIPAAFDLDSAEGVQLDVDGQWIGRNRDVPIPIVADWFSWGVANRGWGEGYWYTAVSPGFNTAVLDDETYRRLLRAKIIANNGDGTIVSAEAALREYFIGSSLIFILDTSPAIGQIPGTTTPDFPSASMTWQLNVAGQLPSVIDLEILGQELIPIRPAGVNMTTNVTTVDGAPLFGWGLENEFVSGWGVGAWGATPDYVLENILTP
jgi:hypothetical protein